MSKIWVISDTHFFHKKIIEYEQRPENYNELMIKNWNSMIEWNDTVIHLGDLIFQKSPSVLEQLTGNIILVRGNHDRETINWYLSHGIKFVVDKFTLNIYRLNILFTHIPEPKLSSEIDLNIHGHLHRKSHRETGIADYETSGKYKLFSIEMENYKPVLLESFLTRKVGTKELGK